MPSTTEDGSPHRLSITDTHQDSTKIQGRRLPNLRVNTASSPTNQEDSLDSSASDTKSRKEKVTQQIHKIRRKLNPRSNRARWRYRTDKTKIVEEEDNHSDLSLTGGEDASIALSESFHGEFGSTTDAEMLHVSDSILQHSPNVEPRSILRRSQSSSPIETVMHHTNHQRSVQRRLHLRGVSFDNDTTPTSHGSIASTSPSMDNGLKLRTFSSNAKEFRVKPHHCFSGTVYMTEAEIYRSMMRPSQQVEFLQSYVKPTLKKPPITQSQVNQTVQRLYGTPQDRRIGSLRVETLGCVGLASVKPDVSVYLICGDSAFVTDAVHSCRSPMWPFQSKRAAVFPVHHAYARLYVGVFGGKKEKNDAFLGRVVLDLAVLRPNTEYDATFPLRSSSFIYDRRPRGVIRLRFSLHWFSEKAAMLSYLTSAKSLSSDAPDKSPSIPCGDPKSFRNVALTLHGKDLPGKYSRTAFRATMREFNLSQQNLRFLVEVLAKDAILYEKPLFSLYIFCTWMYCVVSNSARFAPACLVGYLILNLVSNYFYFNLSEQNHLGYAPPTLREMASSLFIEQETGSVKPLMVKKKAKNGRRGSGTASASYQSVGDLESEEDIEPMDHREFPFSERDEYRKLTVEDALAYHKSAATRSLADLRPTRHRQLSIYVKDGTLSSAACEVDNGYERDEKVEEEDLEESDEDEMNVSAHGDEDSAFLFDEADDDDEDDIELSRRLRLTASQLLRRIPLGPPQDSGKQPRKRIPPQVVLSRAENKLHRFTGNISMDKVFHTNLVRRADRTLQANDESELPFRKDHLDTQKRKQREHFDDYDKRLGFRKRHTNPVTQVTAGFLGPIMRIIRVFLVALRVFFNVFAWKDPMLSFWVLVILVLLMAVLLAFPWRSFFFLVGVGCFGPQNILVRKHIEAKEAKKTEEEIQNGGSSDGLSSSLHSTVDGSSHSAGGIQEEDEDHHLHKRGPRQRIQHKIARIKERRRLKKEESMDSQHGVCPARPPFTAHRPSKSSARNNQLLPRDVVVPYTRGRTERFYDWPPDPTVARATPISVADSAPVAMSLEEKWMSLAPDTTQSEQGDSNLRRRPSALQKEE